ncbi:hypothetical protein ACJJIG_16150 [Microbulbifer sp. SSSA007]|uniref:hypothetical protein n=1 Tax=Microbulbifer sp. SSSA007 TaxID=3243379 RepID=UPI004039EE13
MSICDFDECSYKNYSDASSCALHLEKGGELNGSIRSDFFDLLIESIADQTAESSLSSEKSQLKGRVIGCLKRGQLPSDLVLSGNKPVFVFSGVDFPSFGGSGQYNYLDALRILGRIHFNQCKFWGGILDLHNTQVSYQECRFYNNWTVSKGKLLEEYQNVLYDSCRFEGDVLLSGGDGGAKDWSAPVFSDCDFKGKLELSRISFGSRVFDNSDRKGRSAVCNSLIVSECSVSDAFVINNTIFQSILIRDSTFSGKFKIRESQVGGFESRSVDFDNKFDLYGTKFGSFSLEKVVCEGFVNLEESEFGLLDLSEGDLVAKFAHVTFLDFANFRGAKFYSGLDIEKTNIKNSPNFLNADVSFEGTNRETLRIIKDSFDGVGNHIEANKYFVLEMNKYREELSSKPRSQEKFILWLSSKISGFGVSYLRPLFYFFALSVLYYLLILGYEGNYLYKAFPGLSPFIIDHINGFASNISPFKRFLKEGMEFISLIFYIAFAILVWHVVVAVKRHVRR